MQLDPFYPIVDSSAWVARLVPLGVKLLQLRIKDGSEEGLRSEIAQAKDLCVAHGCQLVVNDHWEQALEAGCDLVHLGQEDLAGADLNAIRRAGVKLGISTHDGDELETALSCAPDYIALGPIFQTSSKDLTWQPQGLAKIAGWKKRTGDTPLVAIGGIIAERAGDVLEAGADSLAVIGDVTRHPDPETRISQWLEATQKWR